MNTLIIALYLSSLGWLFSRRWLVTRHISLRHEGHPQYFVAVLLAALVALLSGSLVASGLPDIALAFFDLNIKSIMAKYSTAKDGDHLHNLTMLAIVATPVAPLVAALWNIPCRYSSALSRKICEHAGLHGGFDEVVYRAQECAIFTMVTLLDSKVYIGVVQYGGKPQVRDDSTFVTLIPILSGYRTHKRRQLRITTQYARVYEIFRAAGTAESAKMLDAFAVSVRFDQIQSIQTFDAQTYANFVEGESLESNESANPPASPSNSEAVLVTLYTCYILATVGVFLLLGAKMYLTAGLMSVVPVLALIEIATQGRPSQD